MCEFQSLGKAMVSAEVDIYTVNCKTARSKLLTPTTTLFFYKLYESFLVHHVLYKTINGTKLNISRKIDRFFHNFLSGSRACERRERA